MFQSQGSRAYELQLAQLREAADRLNRLQQERDRLLTLKAQYEQAAAQEVHISISPSSCILTY
jgi:hypothetical protein